MKSKGILTKSENQALHKLGRAIIEQPKALQKLLQSYGYRISLHDTEDAIIEDVISIIAGESSAFHLALSTLITKDHEDQFNLGEVLGKPSGQGGVTIGADPVSAVAGAIGSIANLVGSAKQHKLAQRQASAQTLNAMLAYQSQQAALQQQRQQQMLQAKVQQNKATQQKQLLKILGAVVVIGMVAIFLMRDHKKHFTPVTQNTSHASA